MLKPEPRFLSQVFGVSHWQSWKTGRKFPYDLKPLRPATGQMRARVLNLRTKCAVRVEGAFGGVGVYYRTIRRAQPRYDANRTGNEHVPLHEHIHRAIGERNGLYVYPRLRPMYNFSDAIFWGRVQRCLRNQSACTKRVRLEGSKKSWRTEWVP